MSKLSDRFISILAVNPGQKDRLVFDAGCPGFGVRVTAKGTRTFLVQWTDQATKRKVREPLGVWGSLTVDQARDAARVRLGRVAQGVNPRAERIKVTAEADRERAETGFTFGQLVTEWSTLHLAHRRKRYADEADRAIRVSLASLIDRPAARITREDAVAALDKLAKAGRTAMAGRTMAYARAAYQWAYKRGKVPANPFAGLPIPAGATQRDRVLDDAELREVWQAVGGLGNPFGPCLQLLLLTLVRVSEVAHMRWSELAPDLSKWTIPAGRMKAGKAHVVHLTEAAREVLCSVPRFANQDLIFSTTGKSAVSGFSKAKTRIDAAIVASRGEALPPWVFHDFRRSGVSRLAQLGFDSIIADKLLAHAAGKLRGVAAVYQRYDFAAERAKALEAWSAHVIGTANAGANVMTFAKKAG